MGDSYLDRIGDRFKELRKEKNLTLKELSEKTGLSIGYLSNLERNISSPTLEYMQRICEILGVSITELLAPEKEEHTLIKKDDRVTLLDNDILKCESINYGNYGMECLCITLHPGVSFHETWVMPMMKWGLWYRVLWKFLLMEKHIHYMKAILSIYVQILHIPCLIPVQKTVSAIGL